MNVNRFYRIKEIVSMEEVALFYGYKPNKAGFLTCPFHREKTGSLKIYEKSFFCFGCGKHGDVVSFVSELYGLKPMEALKKIENDFGVAEHKMGLKEKQAEARRIEEERYRKRVEAERKEAETTLLNYHRLCWQHKDDIKSPIFVEACSWFEEAEYFLDFFDQYPAEFLRLNKLWLHKVKARVDLMEERCKESARRNIRPDN